MADYQYRVRFRAKEDAPFGAWTYLESKPYTPMVFNSRKEAEREAQKHASGRDVSITATDINGY